MSFPHVMSSGRVRAVSRGVGWCQSSRAHLGHAHGGVCRTVRASWGSGRDDRDRCDGERFAAGQRRSGWPHAFTLVELTSASYTFVLLLLESGQDINTAVVATLTLAAGIAMLVLPAAGGSLLRRLGAAIVAALSHSGAQR